MAGFTEAVSANTHEATSNPALVTGVLGPTVPGCAQQTIPDALCGLEVVRELDGNCSGWLPLGENPAILLADYMHSNAQRAADPSFPADSAADGLLTESVVEPEAPHKKPTLLDLRAQKIHGFLQSIGKKWASSAEIGAALEEPDITVRARRVAVCNVLKKLEAEGIEVTRTGTHNSRRYKLASEVTDEDGAIETPTAKPRHKKITRWGLSQRGDELLIRDCPIELDALALRCLRLLIENPLGITRGTLLRTLREQEPSVYYTEVDVLNALGEVKDRVNNDDRSPRIYEWHKTHSHGHFKLIMIAGRVGV